MSNSARPKPSVRNDYKDNNKNFLNNPFFLVEILPIWLFLIFNYLLFLYSPEIFFTFILRIFSYYSYYLNYSISESMEILFYCSRKIEYIYSFLIEVIKFFCHCSDYAVCERLFTGIRWGNLLSIFYDFYFSLIYSWRRNWRARDYFWFFISFSFRIPYISIKFTFTFLITLFLFGLIGIHF